VLVRSTVSAERIPTHFLMARYLTSSDDLMLSVARLPLVGVLPAPPVSRTISGRSWCATRSVATPLLFPPSQTSEAESAPGFFGLPFPVFSFRSDSFVEHRDPTGFFSRRFFFGSFALFLRNRARARRQKKLSANTHSCAVRDFFSCFLSFVGAGPPNPHRNPSKSIQPIFLRVEGDFLFLVATAHL